MGDFRKLLVWKKAHAMALEAQRIAGRIRSPQHFALRNQITRAAMSEPANIVEGCGEQTDAQYSGFLRIALNSSTEFEYHLLMARELRLVNQSDYISITKQVVEVRRMLYGLRRYLSAQMKQAKRPVPGLKSRV